MCSVEGEEDGGEKVRGKKMLLILVWCTGVDGWKKKMVERKGRERKERKESLVGACSSFLQVINEKGEPNK